MKSKKKLKGKKLQEKKIRGRVDEVKAKQILHYSPFQLILNL
jgi:RNase H-fold protein (predicted Holliday junction resolvase)